MQILGASLFLHKVLHADVWSDFGGIISFIFGVVAASDCCNDIFLQEKAE